MNAHANKVEEVFARAEQLRLGNKLREALAEYIHLTFIEPRHWLAYYYAGRILAELGQLDAAVVASQRAVEINPDEVLLWVSLGVCFKKNDQMQAAKNAFDHGASCEPNNIYVLYNLGEWLLDMNRPAEAMEYFERILSGEEDEENIKARSQWLRGVCKLSMGQYVEGWDDYESRVNHPTTTFPVIPGEKWTGQDLHGKTLLVAFELRFGDVIQFSRFIHRLVPMAARVILQMPPELVRQFSTIDADVDIVQTSEPLPEYDYYQFATSIPAILKLRLDEIENAPYLHIDETAKKPALPMRKGSALKVGLVWAGKPIPNRSIPLSFYVPLLRHPDVSFFSFQLGRAREELNTLSVGWLIQDLSAGIKDFYDSSVLMKQMDLIITIDTAAAHQAGALGLPVWMMQVYSSDWRWGNADDDVTHWYPTLRLFRQTEYGSWQGASERLYKAFDEWVEQSIKQAETKRVAEA